MAWYSSATGRLGVLAQDVAAGRLAGRLAGDDARAPTTSRPAGSAARRSSRAPGGGFYAAYRPGYRRRRRARVAGRRLPRPRHHQAQRLRQHAGGDRRRHGRPAVARRGRQLAAATPWIVAARSNRKATGSGATVSRAAPEGHAGRLPRSTPARRRTAASTCSATSTTARARSTATYHRRILPGLTLRAAPRKVRKGEMTDVRFTVLDAGDPVKGATVTRGRQAAARPTPRAASS